MQMPDKTNDENLIKLEVEKRRREIEDKLGSGGGDDGTLAPAFIQACLRTKIYGDGEIYKALHEGKFVFNKTTLEWLKWAGHHWEEDLVNESLAAVEKVAEVYEKEAARLATEAAQADKEDRKRLWAKVKALEDRAGALRGATRRQHVLQYAHTTEGPMMVRGTELDADPWLLGCKNGVIELKTGRHRPGRPEDHILRASKFDWLGIDAPCPTWHQAVLDIMGGDEVMVAFMQRLLGMAIWGKTAEKIFPVFIGPGGNNGKTTLIEAVSETLGTLAAPVCADMFTAGYKKQTSGLDPEMMALKGLRFAYANETEDNAKVSAAKVKQLTGKDTLTARSPYDKRPTTWEPTHNLFLLSNYKLRADSEDQALWSRTVYVPFEVRFVDREPENEKERRANPYIDEELKKEGSGILAWLVNGFLAWQENGLDIPLKVQKESKEARKNMDIFGQFVDECLFVDDTVQDGISASELYAHYEVWHRKHVGRFVPSMRKFGQYFKTHYESKKSGVMKYYGLAYNWEAIKYYPTND